MRVALVHDYIKEYGGAERVLETLHEIYPDADVYTSVYLPRFLGPHRERFKNWKIKTSWFQHVPFNHKLISPFRLVAAWTFAQFDLSEYDVVIVSATGAYFPNMVKTKKSNSVIARSEATKQSRGGLPRSPSTSSGSLAMTGKDGALHICYCHTPPRYLYGYATAREWKKNKLFAVLAGAVNHFLRMVDFRASQNVDFYLANSEEIAGRIRKFYRRDSIVIYPPVEINSLSFPRRRESRRTWIPDQVGDDKEKGYYLTGGRLARAKHVDLIIKACQELGVPLKVFGRGFAGYESELHSLTMNNEQRTKNTIEFLGEVSDQEKAELMAGAKAFLFASEDEDFGIVPVEAMAHGLPVIAHNSGGVKETVIDGQTGIFFDKLTVASLKEAINKFETLQQAQGKKLNENCRKQAEKFSKEHFVKEIEKFVKQAYKNNF